MAQRIKIESSWYVDTYKVGSKILTDIHRVSIDGKEYMAGKFVRRGSYNDMGHTYSYSTNDYKIHTPFGRINLSQLLEEGVVVNLVRGTFKGS